MNILAVHAQKKTFIGCYNLTRSDEGFKESFSKLTKATMLNTEIEVLALVHYASGENFIYRIVNGEKTPLPNTQANDFNESIRNVFNYVTNNKNNNQQYLMIWGHGGVIYSDLILDDLIIDQEITFERLKNVSHVNAFELNNMWYQSQKKIQHIKELIISNNKELQIHSLKLNNNLEYKNTDSLTLSKAIKKLECYEDQFIINKHSFNTQKKVKEIIEISKKKKKELYENLEHRNAIIETLKLSYNQKSQLKLIKTQKLTTPLTIQEMIKTLPDNNTKIDLVFYNSCQMAHVETIPYLIDNTNIIISSQLKVNAGDFCFKHLFKSIEVSDTIMQVAHKIVETFEKNCDITPSKTRTISIINLENYNIFKEEFISLNDSINSILRKKNNDSKILANIIIKSRPSNDFHLDNTEHNMRLGVDFITFLSNLKLNIKKSNRFHNTIYPLVLSLLEITKSSILSPPYSNDRNSLNGISIYFPKYEHQFEAHHIEVLTHLMKFKWIELLTNTYKNYENKKSNNKPTKK